MDIATLSKLLTDIDKNRSKDFVGLGLIIYERFELLPITSLTSSSSFIQLPIADYSEVVKVLLLISEKNHPNHDGFHLLSTNFELTHLSQYFSTPIVNSAKINFQYGSRYRTALYGSYLPNIFACCIIGNNYGPLIFKQGETISL